MIRCWLPDSARRAIIYVREVIKPSGAIYVIGEGVLDHSRVSPLAAARVAVGDVNRFDEAQAYTEQEHRQRLDEAGFEAFERVTLPNGFGIVTARRAT